MALFSLAEFKTHQSISGTGLDTLISGLADRVTDHFERLLHRKGLDGSASFTEDYSGEGQRTLALRYTPVVSITSISVDLNRTFATALAATDYVLDKEAGLVKRVETQTIPRIPRTGPVWPRGDYNIRVVYSAGYGSTPLDLKEAAILWAARILNKRKLMGLQSETIGSHSVSAFGSAGGASLGALDPDIGEMIAPFRSYPQLGDVRDAT